MNLCNLCAESRASLSNTSIDLGTRMAFRKLINLRSLKSLSLLSLEVYVQVSILNFYGGLGVDREHYRNR